MSLTRTEQIYQLIMDTQARYHRGPDWIEISTDAEREPRVEVDLSTDEPERPIVLYLHPEYWASILMELTPDQIRGVYGRYGGPAALWGVPIRIMMSRTPE